MVTINNMFQKLCQVATPWLSPFFSSLVALFETVDCLLHVKNNDMKMLNQNFMLLKSPLQFMFGGIHSPKYDDR